MGGLTKQAHPFVAARTTLYTFEETLSLAGKVKAARVLFIHSLPSHIQGVNKGFTKYFFYAIIIDTCHLEMP